ncbi:MAG TPA: ferredoxin III, nif-specific [Rhodocyclaceae bacterium]|nr:ferredoxin III, nif-specific [Rhodocyclaceae bacterium]
MSEFQSLTRDGTVWVPLYLDEVNPEACIGCGRCYKVCSHHVLEMKAISEDGEIVDADDGDAERMVMVVANKGKCIGCNACGKVCTSKAAQVHVAATA